MIKSVLLLLSVCFIAVTGCSNDDSNPTTPVTGEVLLASVSGDSVGTSLPGFSSRTISVSSGTLNFTDRDSARISFFYSGNNNSTASPLTVFYSANDTTNVNLFSSIINPATTEQFINVTVPSPKVNTSFNYKIVTGNITGSSYFKFRDLNIYKK